MSTGVWILIGVLVVAAAAWVAGSTRGSGISVQDWAGEIAGDARDYARGTARHAIDAQRDYWHYDDGNGED